MLVRNCIAPTDFLTTNVDSDRANSKIELLDFCSMEFTMPRITHYMPELDPVEKLYIEDLVDGLSSEQAQLFASAYRQRRKDPHTPYSSIHNHIGH
jgi:hypothetical protein